MLGIFEKRRQRLAENLAVAETELADVNEIITALTKQINYYEIILATRQEEISHTCSKPPRLTVKKAPKRLVGRQYEPATAALVFHNVDKLLAAAHQEHHNRVNGRYETRDQLKSEAEMLTARITKLRVRLMR